MSNQVDKKVTISASLEDYLEAIAEIIEENGHAHTKGIAAKLAVKMPSVTNALQVLAQHGYIEYSPNQPVTLTESGKKEASRIMRRHHVLETFFTEIFKVAPEEASSLACKIEHVINDDIVNRFLFFSEAIQFRNDCLSLRTYLDDAMKFSMDIDNNYCVASSLGREERAIVVKVSSSSNEAEALKEAGFVEGAKVELIGYLPEHNSYKYKIAGNVALVKSSEAENIWLKKNNKI